MTIRSLNALDPTTYFFRTSDNTELRLIRYQGGSKGPVMLAPGFGTSTPTPGSRCCCWVATAWDATSCPGCCWARAPR